jgi:riboflavin kinase
MVLSSDMLNSRAAQPTGMQQTAPGVGHDELAALKLIALDGGLAGDVKISCAGLAGRLDASSQTASRRLQRLDEAGLLARTVVSDGQEVSVTDDGEATLRREYADYRRLFDADGDTLRLAGTVTGGMGEGRHYISLPGYMEQFRDRLGYEPFPGTLNVELTDESVRARPEMAGFDAVPIDGWEDEERTFGPATCFAAAVEGDGGTYEDAHVIVPERTHHDESQLEVIAPEKLRDALSLSDEDRVVVRIRGVGE